MSGGVLIVAGGTGGHVFPALAVAERLQRRGVAVAWMGTPAGLEARVVADAGIRFLPVAVRGLRGRRWRETLTAPAMLAHAAAQALRGVAGLRPRVVLGMGGYASGPGCVAAWLLRRPLVIHEQNAVAGMTNQRLARLARRVLTGFDRPFPGAADARFVGNPVRESVCAVSAPRQRLAERHGPLRLLVLGGSLGARSLNQAVPRAIASVPAPARPVVRHQAGERTLALARSSYEDCGVEADIRPFIEDMAEAYAWADLVICRAGALTVAELAAVGVASVLVPYPHAVDDHQAANAAYLVDVGAACMIQDHEVVDGALAPLLASLAADRARLRVMADRARDQGRPEAAEAVLEACLEVAL